MEKVDWRWNSKEEVWELLSSVSKKDGDSKTKKSLGLYFKQINHPKGECIELLKISANEKETSNYYELNSFVEGMMEEHKRIVFRRARASGNANDLDLVDLKMMWSMPSKFGGDKIVGDFFILSVSEKDDYYLINVAGDDMLPLNPMQMEVRVEKFRRELGEQLVGLIQKKAFLIGRVVKNNARFAITKFYFNVEDAI